MRPLVIGKRSHQFLEVVLLLDHLAIRARLSGEDNEASLPSDALSAKATALFRCSKNSLAVAPELARANSAEANSGSSAMALSKCWTESCA